MAENKYFYKAKTKWTEGKRMKLMIEGKPDMEVSTPPEFGGPEGFLSPEDLFVAAANTCYTTTFFAISGKAKLNYVDFMCKVEGTLEKIGEEGFRFTKIDLYPELIIAEEGDREKAEYVLKMSKKYCLVTNSMNSAITLSPTIKVKNE